MNEAAYILGTLILAGGCLGLAFRLSLVDPVRGAASRVMLIAVALGLLLTVIFPVGDASEVRTWALAVVFTGLPCAAWMLARNRPPQMLWRMLQAAGGTAALLLIAMLVLRPGSVLSDVVFGAPLLTSVEHVLIAVEIVLVPLMALAVLRLRPPQTAANGAPGNDQGRGGVLYSP
ncbi:hypothetical protein SAMN05421505_105261 [Sinosporangium album]|uniref:Uncharacterized protein n=1 Tax=Sinosporangium album TaxID=504805 RepID=A0A1G7VGG6_9ACTN|nr:hypothetical protein [Sinosporangium album]SDG58834.1 hypothetical protein SAMN05421505_105261 [Sinosporangium album]